MQFPTLNQKAPNSIFNWHSLISYLPHPSFSFLVFPSLYFLRCSSSIPLAKAPSIEMRPPSGETIGSSSDAVRGAVDNETSLLSDESIHTSSVERYRDNAGNQYQAQDENYLLVLEASKARRIQELFSDFNRAFLSPAPALRLRDEGPHFSHLKNASSGSWELSGTSFRL